MEWENGTRTDFEHISMGRMKSTLVHVASGFVSLSMNVFGRKIVSFEPLSMAGKATRCTMEKALLGFGTSATSAK